MRMKDTTMGICRLKGVKSSEPAWQEITSIIDKASDVQPRSVFTTSVAAVHVHPEADGSASSEDVAMNSRDAPPTVL